MPEILEIPDNYIEMKQKDIKTLREKIYLNNNKICPVLNTEIPLEKMVLDHAHKRKCDEYAPNKGTVREVLEFRVNAFCGKIENNFKRYGLDKEYDLVQVLRNAANYFEAGPYRDEEGFMYIHPREVHPEKKLKKQSYNKLLKIYTASGGKAKFPEYPKSKKLSKKLSALFDKYEVQPEFYK